jgi:hypothetical protein
LPITLRGKKGFDAAKVHRDNARLTERYVLRDVDKPNFVTVVLESASAEGATKFFFLTRRSSTR